MKAEAAKKLADEALIRLSEALKAGRSDELTRYLSVLSRFHRYSFGNVMLILFQCPTATQVAGFTTWKSLGRFVKRGEKGIVIIAPMVIRPKEETSDDKSTRPLLRFMAVYVFDVSQTDGESLPALSRVTGDPQEALARLTSAAARHSIALEEAELLGGADGLSKGGTIVLRQGLSPAERFSVLAHELAHELLHRGDDRPASKTVRETEAEAVAFVVSSAIGLETGTSSSDYIQLYQGDAELLAASLDRIQKVSSLLIEYAMGGEAEDPA